MKIQKEKIIIVVTVFIDVLGLAIIIPVLPFYVESFGASALTLTMLFSVFSFFSFVSSPFLGTLSDRVGRRPILIISILSTAIGWIVFASAHTLWVLFLGRVIDGMAAGNLFEQGQKVHVFPIFEYWRDIGRPEDFARANDEFPEKPSAGQVDGGSEWKKDA